jgi:hypothetical protein
MILRRLMSHVSDQNWFAVALDFVIVVLGVAVGFQLTGYYDEVQRRDSERTYLVGIATDYEIYQGLLICRTEGEAAIAAALNDLLREIDGVELDDGERAAVINALPMSHVVQPGLAMEGNTSALISGDLVSTIGDAQLRGLILAAQSIGSVAVGSLEQIEGSYLAIARFDALTTRAWNEQIGFFVVTDYDIEAMRAAPGLRDDLMNVVNLHRVAELSDQRLLVAVESVLDRLVALGARAEPETPAVCPYGPAAGS